MRTTKILVYGCIVLLLSISTLTYSNPQTHQPTLCAGKQVVGRIEKVTIVEKNLTLDAKLDTGATMASLSATNIQIFKRDAKEWVQFTLYIPSTKEKIIFTEPLVRYTHILNRSEETKTPPTSQDNQYSSRPVISLTMNLGNERETILVNLVDRTHFHYPILLGSAALKKFNVVIDASQNYLVH